MPPRRCRLFSLMSSTGERFGGVGAVGSVGGIDSMDIAILDGKYGYHADLADVNFMPKPRENPRQSRLAATPKACEGVSACGTFAHAVGGAARRLHWMENQEGLRNSTMMPPSLKTRCRSLK
jgi:hypothetical protein